MCAWGDEPLCTTTLKKKLIKSLSFLFTFFFMSVDACNLHSSSIFLQKIRPREEKKKTSFSKLQSVGLSLVASVSKRKANDNTLLNKYASTTSLPSTVKPPTRLKPSISARPFSQFFFPIKEEEESTNKINLINEQQTTGPEKKKINKRHSVSVDLIDDSTSNYSSSRSSSLKTIKTQLVLDNVIIETNSDIQCIQSDITFPTTNNNNKRLSGVARARTVLGLDSNKSREIRAIHVWKEAIAQLSTTDDEQDELYNILSHPALIVTIIITINYYKSLIICFFRFSRSSLWSDNALYDNLRQKT